MLNEDNDSILILAGTDNIVNIWQKHRCPPAHLSDY